MRLVALCLMLAACSGGGDGDPPKITITPAAATLFSGLPSSFQITGGTPPYSVSSSDQATLPFDGSSNGPLVLLANPVSTDTPVTLTVRDSASTPPATAALTVKPNFVSTAVTFSPTPCAPAVCGDFTATATLSEGQIPLPNRPIAFSVESGDFSIISADSLTDASGRATAHLQVPTTAQSQAARLRVTDTLSGLFGSVVFQTAKPPSAGTGQSLIVAPNSLSFTGFSGSCAAGPSAQVAVVGGTTPYQILPVQGFTVTPSILGASGQQFTVTTQGACGSASITVLDAAGNSASVAVVNAPGAPNPQPPPALTVQPTAVELASCTNTATIFFAGGAGTYTVSSTNSAVLVSQDANSATLKLIDLPAYPPTVAVIVQSGSASKTVTVKIDPPSCP